MDMYLSAFEQKIISITYSWLLTISRIYHPLKKTIMKRF